MANARRHFVPVRIIETTTPGTTLSRVSDRVIFFMSSEPAVKRAVVYFDGQNLFNMAKKRFGYTFPNYCPHALASHVCASRGWTLSQIRFYTGLPEDTADPRRQFWQKKLAALGRKGAFLYTRDTRHGQEKGIDIRVALDVVGGALRREYDVAVIFSQDQDFTEVADEIRWIASDQARWIKLACAFPDDGTQRNGRPVCQGIRNTDWIPILTVDYDASIDPVDYRPTPHVAPVTGPGTISPPQGP